MNLKEKTEKMYKLADEIDLLSNKIKLITNILRKKNKRLQEIISERDKMINGGVIRFIFSLKKQSKLKIEFENILVEFDKLYAWAEEIKHKRDEKINEIDGIYFLKED